MKHILVIRLSALGDVAIMVPVLKAFAKANPDVHFTVAAPPLLEPLFADIQNVNFLGLNKKQSPLKLFRALDAVGADTVVDLHKVNRVGFALTLLRLRHLSDLHFRIHALRKGRLSRWLFLHHLRTAPRRPQHLRYADTFRRAGLKVGSGERRAETPHPPLPTPPLPTPHSPQIGIAPFAQHEGKIWPWENTSALALALAGRGHCVLLFGSRAEAAQLESLASRHPNITSLAGKHTFAEEMDIIRSLRLMVSMDSANMHFASAVGTPVVSIWGATHPDFGFYGYGQDPANALCAGLPCQPCSAFGQKACRFGDRRCLRAVTPEQVLARIEAILR